MICYKSFLICNVVVQLCTFLYYIISYNLYIALFYQPLQSKITWRVGKSYFPPVLGLDLVHHRLEVYTSRLCWIIWNLLSNTGGKYRVPYFSMEVLEVLKLRVQFVHGINSLKSSIGETFQLTRGLNLF